MVDSVWVLGIWDLGSGRTVEVDMENRRNWMSSLGREKTDVIHTSPSKTCLRTWRPNDGGRSQIDP